MIKRLLLSLVAVFVLIGIAFSNISTIVLLKIIGVLVFSTLGLSFFYSGAGCYSNQFFIALGTVCFFIAFLILVELLGGSVFRNYELPTSLCQVVVSDMNKTVISDKIVPC